MKNGGRKIWTCLLALALMLAMMPAAALTAEATEYSGDDTKTHYWKDLQVGDIISPGAKLNTDMDKEGKTIVVWLQGGRYCKADGAKQTESTKVSISYFNSSDVGFGEAYSDASYRRYPYAAGSRVDSWVVAEKNTNGGVFLTLKGYKPYELTVENGSGGGNYHDGANVSISADAASEGKQFKEWTWKGVDDLTFTSGDKYSTSPKIEMPANDITVTATYEETTDIRYREGEYDETSGKVDYTEKRASDYTKVASDTTTWKDGNWYVVNKDVTIGSRIKVSGTANLILCDGCTLTANKGISLNKGNTLNIYAQSDGDNAGKLSASANEYEKAGIGGDSNNYAGTLSIHGGVIEATGGRTAAGIGGGYAAGDGTFTVYGGDITAKGGYHAAGIGGGEYSNGSTLTVYGGKLTAKGGSIANGIGAGYMNYGTANTTIKGGDVTATGGSDGQGINGTLTIDDGMVAQAGGSSADNACQNYAGHQRKRYVHIWPHTHEVSLSASGNTLTGSCSGEGTCSYEDNEFTLSINASDAEYDGNSHGATLSYTSMAHGLSDLNLAAGTDVSESDITYSGRDETTYSSSDAPSAVGKYTAQIAAGENTLSVDYEITSGEVSLESVNVEQSYTTTSVDASVAGLMPENAGDLSYETVGVEAPDNVTVSEFSVDGNGNVKAALSGGKAGDRVTLKVKIVSDNYKDVTASIEVCLCEDISGAAVALSADAFTYNGSVQKPSIKTIGGKTLREGTDYTVAWSDASSKNAGSYSVTITGTGKYMGTTSASYKINARSVTPEVALSASSYTYSGGVKTPAVRAKSGSTTFAEGTDYTVTYAKGRKNVGSYKVTVNMKGNYSGSKTVSFKINPKGTSIRSLSRARKAATVKWKKQTGKMSKSRITGYQIQLATDSKFTKNKKTVTVKGYSKTSKKVSGLKAGKKYYVRIRTYKTVSGAKYYSGWSKTRTVTTR